MLNQNPEQQARDVIDRQLLSCGWVIQQKDQINLAAGIGVAVREYSTEVGPADYVLFVNRKPMGVIEAKRKEEAEKFSTHESQVEEYATAKLKRIENQNIPFLYLSTGEITRFTDTRDPSPRYREIFSFHRPETLEKWMRVGRSLRDRLHKDIPSLDTTGLRDCQIDAITNLEVSSRKLDLKR